MGAGSLENELGMRGREDRLVFVLLFLFLYFKPNGILGKRIEQKL